MKNHDAGWLEDRLAELAHREHIHRVNNATTCDACGCALTAKRFDDGEFVIGTCCAVKLAGLALDNILADRTRWGAPGEVS